MTRCAKNRHSFDVQEMTTLSVGKRATRAETTPGGVKRIAGTEDVCLVYDLPHRGGLRVCTSILAEVGADEDIVQLIAVGYDLACAGVASSAKHLSHPGATRVVDTATLSKARENCRGKT